MNRKESSSSDDDDDVMVDDNTYKVAVRGSDMDDDMQSKAARIIMEALTIHSKEAQVAKQIKTQFDEKYGRAWQCIVGKHFARLVPQLPSNYTMDICHSERIFLAVVIQPFNESTHNPPIHIFLIVNCNFCLILL